MKVNTKNNSRKAGFSLVEMLVVITIIGVIAAIAVPNIGRLTDAAEESKDKRNAQNLASVSSSAQAAGLDFVALAGNDEATCVGLIVDGATVTTGAFQGTFFGVPNLSTDEQNAVDAYLSVSQGVLKYHENGDG